MNDIAAYKLQEWRERPAQYIEEVFGTEPDDWQLEICEAFPHNQRIAMQACKGPGKTGILAMLTWNFLTTRPHPKCVATSITGDNLRDGLWAEMAKWQKRAPLLEAAFTWNKERIFLKEHPETWFVSARTWPKDGNVEQQADTLAGIHADYVLFIIDEAGGIPESVMIAADAGLSTGIETKIIMAGNPTHRSGPLFNAATRDRKYWFIKEINGDPDDPKRAKRIDKAWAQKLIDTYGRDHDWVRVNVLGQFPTSSDNTIISPYDVEQAMKRVVPEDEYRLSAKVLGVDVARFGSDRSVFTLRHGRVTFEQEARRGWDLMQTTGYVVYLMEKHQPDATFVDSIGLGSGVVDRLRELGHDVIGVNTSIPSPDPTYLNLRAQMWSAAAEWVRGGGSLPEDHALARELTSMPYEFASNGKLKVKSKDDMKKAGFPSPDLADSFVLTFAYPVAPKNRLLQGKLTRSAVHEYNPFEELQHG